jgi:rod shape-determining protein MreC
LEHLAIKPLFAKGPSLGVRLLVLVVLSATLMVVDARFESLKPMRSQLGLVLTPFYWLAAANYWAKTKNSRPKPC